MGTSRRCLSYEHSCLFPALVPLGSDMGPHNGISPSSIFSKQCVGSGFGSTWFPHGSAKRNLTELNVFKLLFAIMLASGVTRYRLASWFLVHARRLYHVPLLKKSHSHPPKTPHWKLKGPGAKNKTLQTGDNRQGGDRRADRCAPCPHCCRSTDRCAHACAVCRQLHACWFQVSGPPHPPYNTNDTGAGGGEPGGSSQRPPGLLISIIIGVRALHKSIVFV